LDRIQQERQRERRSDASTGLSSPCQNHRRQHTQPDDKSGDPVAEGDPACGGGWSRRAGRNRIGERGRHADDEK